MFIKQLYLHSKWLCFIFTGFIVLFIFINYKRGVVATPVLQYGMFSEVFHKADTQVAYHIYVNDKPLDITRYDFAKRDILLISLENYEKIKYNKIIFSTIKTVLNKAGVGGLMQQEVYSNTINDTIFTNWYTRLVEQIVQYPVLKIAVLSQKFVWLANEMQPASAPEKLPFIVTD